MSRMKFRNADAQKKYNASCVKRCMATPVKPIKIAIQPKQALAKNDAMKKLNVNLP